MPEWLMLLNMEGTLGRYSDSDFSETARSDPGHGEAGRHRVRLRRLLAEARRRSTHGVSEGTAERADAGETDGEADIGHAASTGCAPRSTREGSPQRPLPKPRHPPTGAWLRLGYGSQLGGRQLCPRSRASASLQVSPRGVGEGLTPLVAVC